MKIGVIGGGLMGLALAQRLTRQGHTVTVFERERQIGGLTTWYDYGPFTWDKFYHVILPTDAYLIHFLEDIGLGDRLRWARTLTGFYVDRQFYSMSSALEFLRFPPVSLLGKIRLALTILYCARINDWHRLEQIPVADWLRRLGGVATYEKIWKPLLLAKLGDNYQRVSAVFIWSYIKRMFSAREGSAKKEQLGHVSGGYKTVFERLRNIIHETGGTIRTEVTVSHIHVRPEGGVSIQHGDRTEHYDKVIFTSPTNVLRQVAAPTLFRVDERDRQVDYLGVICMVLVTRKPLMPYYVVNIADPRIPFTGIIGMSNLVSTSETAGLHITFLPKYVDSNNPILKQSDEVLEGEFFAGLRLMFPDFEDKGIESVHINRAIKVQPLQVIDYSSMVPRVESAHPDFFVLNTAQFTHMTLNNNEVIRAVDGFLQVYGDRFAGEPFPASNVNPKMVDKGKLETT